MTYLLASAADDPDRNAKGLICALVAVIVCCGLLMGGKKKP